MKKFLKQFNWIMIWLLILGWVFAAWLVQRNNSKLELSQYSTVYTNDGTPTWTPVAWINTWWDSIFYWPLLDWWLNPYITGWALSWYSTWVSLWEYTGNVLKPITTLQINLAGGNNNNAVWSYSVALWKDSQAVWFTSVAIWHKAIASWSQAVSIWYATSASGDNSTALWFSTKAVWFTSTAMWYNTNAAWMHSTTMWYYTNAWWDHSIAMWYNAGANGIRSISIWDNTTANGEKSIAMWFSSTAAGFNSTTMWYWTIANGDYSTAMWQLSIAQWNFSSAHGLSTQANRQAATTVGQYNSWNLLSLFQVGIGTNDTDRRNGFEVTDLWNIFMNELTGYTCLATDATGMVYDNTGVFTNYIPRTSVDTGWNNTGSDTIIPSEKTVRGLVDNLTNNYIPYRSGDKLFNSNMLFYTNTHIGTYSAGDTALLNIRKTWSSLKWININLNTGGLYNGVWLDIKASRPIITTTHDIWDPLNTTNISNNSEDNAGYFMTNNVSNLWYSSAIGKWWQMFVASKASSNQASWWYYITSWSNAISLSEWSRRIVMSWVNLSIQVYAGWAWVEKWVFTP